MAHAQTAQQRPRQRRRLSLSVRFSLLVLCAALLPLIAVVGINNYLARNTLNQARTTLIQQGTASLATDANSKTALIDAYMHERLLDGRALGSLETAVEFLACHDAFLTGTAANVPCDSGSYQSYVASVGRALKVGLFRDSNYLTWSIYDPEAQLLLSSDTTLLETGGPKVPPEDLQPVAQGRQRVSPVYYDPTSGHAFVRLYTPIAPTPFQASPVLGFLQATLKLDAIWNIVDNDQGINGNGTGSYAFITDENGVRIADTNVGERFTAVAPLAPATQQLISSEQRFGSAHAVTVDDLPAVAAAQQSKGTQSAFQSIAAPASRSLYQFVGVRLQNVPWSYFVLSPLSTVTRVADDQVRVANDQVRASLLSAAVVAVLAILLGLMVGTRTARPVQRSVADLQTTTEALHMLASKQENSAGEQLWVVEACKTGLDSVRYLSDAMHQAARRIIDAGGWFEQYWDRLTEEQAQRTVKHLGELAQYIEEAARRQFASSERLNKAITVTTQVSDQLANGASAAAHNAALLEEVVGQLQHVVGGRPSSRQAADGAAEDLAGAAQPLPGMDGRVVEYDDHAAYPGRALPSGPASPRQLAAPMGNRAPLMPGAWGADDGQGGYDESAYGGGYDDQGAYQSPYQGGQNGGWGYGGR